MWLRYVLYLAAALLVATAGRFLQTALAHPASAPQPDTPPACALEGFCALHPIRAAHPAPSTAAVTAATVPGTPSSHYHEETVAQLLGKGSKAPAAHRRA